MPFDGVKTADEIVRKVWRTAWTPRIPCLVSEWAEKKRRLNQKSSAEPGAWRNARIPYLVDIMDALSDDHPAEHVCFIKPSQVGATECALNWLGWTAEESPAPVLCLFPTEKLGQRWSRTRLQVMIDETPTLAALMPNGRKSDNSNTLTEKDFPGGHIYIGSANIPIDLASTPVQRLLLDEADRFPHEIEDEGDPVEIAIARTRTWQSRRKIFENSSPTIESLSRINKRWNESTKHRYHVPCPHCGELQVLKWNNLQWPEGEPLKAYYVCEANGCVIEEHSKTWMLAKENGAKWIAECPEVTDVWGFHINCLYTPVGLGDSWGKNAAVYEKAKSFPNKLKVFQNTRLGETHKDEKEILNWESVWQRREPVPLRKPVAGILLLTAGVDVQKNYIAVQVVGWGRDARAQVLDYVEKPGDVTRPDVWEWLDEFLSTPIENEFGIDMRISGCAIDSGYQQHDVTNFTRQTEKSRHIFATKGMQQLNRAIIGRPTMVDVNWRGTLWKKGAEQYPLGVGSAKVVVYDRIRADEKALPSGRHYIFSEELGQEYFRGLCSEVFDPHKGKWIKIYERNEPLDTFVLSMGASLHHGVRMQHMREDDWSRLEKTYNPADAPAKRDPAVVEEKPFSLTGRFMPVSAMVRK